MDNAIDVYTKSKQTSRDLELMFQVPQFMDSATTFVENWMMYDALKSVVWYIEEGGVVL